VVLKLEKRRQKSRRNKDPGENSPAILYVILVTHPKDEQKSQHDLCKEGQLTSLRKQKGLLTEGHEIFAFCKCNVCSPISRGFGSNSSRKSAHIYTHTSAYIYTNTQVCMCGCVKLTQTLISLCGYLHAGAADH